MSLKREDAMTHAPDLLLLSQYDPELGEVAAFEELIGSHGGLGGPQTEPFILHPAEWTLDEDVPLGAPTIYRNIRRWLSRSGSSSGRRARLPKLTADAAAAAAAKVPPKPKTGRRPREGLLFGQRTRRGRASVGPRWRRIDGQCLGDRRHCWLVRCGAGCDHRRSDDRDVGRLDSRGPDRRRDPDRIVCRHRCRCPTAKDRSGRSRPRTRFERAGDGPHGAESAIIASSEDAADMRRRMGAAALDMDAASDGSWQMQWRATVAARLPSQRWPERTVLITAVDAQTGEPVVFDRDSGVNLVDAVAASCSSGRPYTIGGSPYIDGGYRSQRRERRSGGRIRAGAGAVTVRRPNTHPPAWGTHLAAQVDELRAGGSRVETIFPDSNT